ncbi:Stress-response A/B barrel domain-containing protein HS1 [Populus alba x Populus x berolinensis]|uniref:Stress-response A/B barrel domain-containing protein HS1 n=1 Tax=Populus alba x Populus x berolinensis TaxID=444605 RepID=A0AAD6M1F8_9ROSI|nr:Stress-response A/B barrel domain-containing protein HS1 [Populus alba x Populus x berolinensis]
MGTDVSIENLHQGFTHIFEATFETLEGRSAYVAHPAHVKFGTALFPTLEKVIVIDHVSKISNNIHHANNRVLIFLTEVEIGLEKLS